MEIVVFSDSHGRSDRLEKAMSYHMDADAIFHLGDGYRDMGYVKVPCVPVYAVKGNGEEWFSFRSDETPTELEVTLEGVKMLLMHGHRFSVKSNYEKAAKYALEKGADILLFGHTHGALETYIKEGDEIGGIKAEKSLYIFNPGSIGEPKFGEPSYGIITLKEGNILLSHGNI